MTATATAIDMHVMAQALDKLVKSKGGLPGGDVEDTVHASSRITREIVVVRPGRTTTT